MFNENVKHFLTNSVDAFMHCTLVFTRFKDEKISECDVRNNKPKSFFSDKSISHLTELNFFIPSYHALEWLKKLFNNWQKINMLKYIFSLFLISKKSLKKYFRKVEQILSNMLKLLLLK